LNSKILIPIFKQLNEIKEKQDELSKLVSKEILHEYSCSELHCIRSIGNLEHPNVTKIANELKMTRGAISKITKKQLKKGLITSYMLDCNKKEIYFRLTELGQKIFDEHEKWHEDFEKRNNFFFDKYTENELILVKEFIDTYISYVDNKIDTLNNK